MKTTLTKEDILREVLESGALGTSSHQIALFKYLLEAKFEGRIHAVKAYSIAVDVFGRKADFDSSVDSIVRVEMFRLRANLKAFNQDSQKFDLELKKASYNIRIKEHVVTSETTQPTIDDRNVMNKDVSPVKTGWRERLFSNASLAALGLAFAFYLGHSLEGPKDLSHCSDYLPNVSVTDHSNAFDLDVYIAQSIKGAASQFSHLNIVPDAKLCRHVGTPGYELQYAVIEHQGNYHITISAYSDDTKKIIASENFTSTLGDQDSTSTTRSDALFYDFIKPVNDILKPNGVIAMNALTAEWENKKGPTDFECIPIMYNSFVSDSDDDYLESLKCFEQAYENNTSNLDNIGGLVASYISQAQNYRPITIENPREKADILMAEIGDDWSDHVETVVAKIYYEAEHPQYNSQRMRNTLMLAEKKFSTHPVVMIEVARHAGFRLGDWEYAKQVSDQAMRLHSERDNSVFFIDATYALLFLPPLQALDTCIKTYSENSIISNLLVNACALRANDSIWIERTEKNLKFLGLETPEQRISFINNKNYDEIFKREFSNTWSKLL